MVQVDWNSLRMWEVAAEITDHGAAFVRACSPTRRCVSQSLQSHVLRIPQGDGTTIRLWAFTSLSSVVFVTDYQR